MCVLPLLAVCLVCLHVVLFIALVFLVLFFFFCRLLNIMAPILLVFCSLLLVFIYIYTFFWDFIKLPAHRFLPLLVSPVPVTLQNNWPYHGSSRYATHSSVPGQAFPWGPLILSDCTIGHWTGKFILVPLKFLYRNFFFFFYFSKPVVSNDSFGPRIPTVFGLQTRPTCTWTRSNVMYIQARVWVHKIRPKANRCFQVNEGYDLSNMRLGDQWYGWLVRPSTDL